MWIYEYNYIFNNWTFYAEYFLLVCCLKNVGIADYTEAF